jgi:hypothetical protein
LGRQEIPRKFQKQSVKRTTACSNSQKKSQTGRFSEIKVNQDQCNPEVQQGSCDQQDFNQENSTRSGTLVQSRKTFSDKNSKQN